MTLQLKRRDHMIEEGGGCACEYRIGFNQGSINKYATSGGGGPGDGNYIIYSRGGGKSNEHR